MAVIDTNSVCTNNIAVLQANSVTAVGRYYTTYHPSYQILRAEAQAVIAAGIKLFVIFEDCPNPVLDQDHGKRDAKHALSQALALGQPQGSAIYFAAEGLPDGYAQRDVNNALAYFSGIGSVISPRYAVGVYSNGVICDALLHAQLCRYAWLSASSSFEGSAQFYASGRWALAQKTPVDIDWQGLSIDNDEAAADFGAFSTLQQPSA
jgi:hypothetical protein